MLDFIDKPWQQSVLVLDQRLGHRVEVCLVGAAATLGDTDEAVFGSLRGLDVYLGRQVTLGVYLVIHIERSILAVAQVVLGECIVNTPAQGFLVIKSCPYLLSLLTMYYGCACVLAEWQDAFCCRLGIAQELQGYILVVFRGLGVAQDLGNLLVVLAAQFELDIVETLLSQHSESFAGYLDYLLAFKLGYGNPLLCQETVLGFVLSQLKHGSVLEFYVCHSIYFIIVC